MKLPQGFQFSQAGLQDYVDCRRRFLLKYIQEVSWPAIESEPVIENESFLQKGSEFHHLVHQHLLGVPNERLLNLIHDLDLGQWWENHQRFLDDLARQRPWLKRYPEVVLTTPFKDYRLVAKFDLLLLGEDGKATIFDWKTSRALPNRKWLERRLQSRIYPYLLVKAGDHLNDGKALEPAQVEMVYWFAGFPGKLETLPYNEKKFSEDEAYLESLVNEIERQEEGDFTKTPHVESCAFCVYRSLCDRGVEAGSFEAMEGDLADYDASLVDLDFEQIAEVAF
jgi:hypothetical protein